MFSFADFVKATTTTEGTGDITLGSSPTGFRSFAQGFADQDVMTVLVVDNPSAPVQWEVFEATYNDLATDTLTRGTLRSSSTGSRINFSAGTKTVVAAPSALFYDLIAQAINADIDATGSSGAYAVTTPAGLAPARGYRITFKANHDCPAGGCTLNPDSHGNTAIKLSDGTDPYAGAIKNGGLYTVEGDGTNFQLQNPSVVGYIDDEISATQTNQIATVRQTVERGPVDGSGDPDVLSDEGTLDIGTNGLSSSNPLTFVMTVDERTDLRVRITSDLTALTLPDDSTRRICVEYDPSDGSAALVDTPEWTFATVAPAGPSTGDVWYNIRHWGLPQEWNGSTWVDKYYSFPLGQVTTASGDITEVINYAYLGRYISEIFSISTNNQYIKACNIGADYVSGQCFVRKNANFQWAQMAGHTSQVSSASATSRSGASVSFSALSVYVGTGTNTILRGDDDSYGMNAARANATDANTGTAQCYVTAQRGF